MPRKPTGNAPGRPRLIRRADGLVDPTRYVPGLKAKRVLAWERTFFKDQAEKSDIDWPVAAKPSEIAAKAGVSTRYVQKLRSAPWFEILFWSGMSTAKLKASGAAKARSRLNRKISDSPDGKKSRDWAWANWPEGGCRSPVNGRHYRTPETFARHLRANRLIPSEWVPTR